MIGELLINGKGACNEFGVNTGDKFPDALGDRAGLKEHIVNNNRTKDGVEYCKSIPKMDKRTLTLMFTIMGDNQADFISKKDLLHGELSRSGAVPSVPKSSAKVCHLKFKDTIGVYTQNVGRTFRKVGVRFIEPNLGSRK